MSFVEGGYTTCCMYSAHTDLGSSSGNIEVPYKPNRGQAGEFRTEWEYLRKQASCALAFEDSNGPWIIELLYHFLPIWQLPLIVEGYPILKTAIDRKNQWITA